MTPFVMCHSYTCFREEDTDNESPHQGRHKCRSFTNSSTLHQDNVTSESDTSFDCQCHSTIILSKGLSGTQTLLDQPLAFPKNYPVTGKHPFSDKLFLLPQLDDSS